MPDTQERKTLSVVIPLFNEEENILPLFTELKATLQTLPYRQEIIFVNDGSSDNSLTELKKLSGITLVDLNRNYGQATALDAGFKAAEGDVIVSMDADGQNVPGDIPLLLRTLDEEKLDVVTGWRKTRYDPKDTLVLTKIGRFLRKLFIADPVHDSGCTLRVYTKEAAKSLDIGGEMHRYILALLRWKGFRIGEVEVRHRKRERGESKYTTSKAVRGFIDLVYVWFIHKYYERPLHLFGYMSLFSLTLAGLTGAWTLYRFIFVTREFLPNALPLFVTLASLAGAIFFFSFGIALDLLIRIQLTLSPYEKRYYVRSVVKT